MREGWLKKLSLRNRLLPQKPLDANIIHILKPKYYKLLLRHVITPIDRYKQVKDFLQEIDVLKAIWLFKKLLKISS